MGTALVVLWLASPSSAVGTCSVTGQGNEIPYASLIAKKQSVRQKQYCNKSMKTLKMVHTKKKRIYYIFIFMNISILMWVPPSMSFEFGRRIKTSVYKIERNARKCIINCSIGRQSLRDYRKYRDK